MTRAYWERVYGAKPADRMSWHQRHPALSLELIAATGAGCEASVLDVGGGASRLVDCLLARGHARVGVLDLAEAAIAESRRRLGAAAGRVEWFVADVTRFVSPHPWDVWHDRAVFHFLVDAADRAAYRRVLERTVPDGGHAVVAAFGPGGPKRCSGLDVMRYGAETLAAELGVGVELVESRREEHRTPAGAVQEFVYCRFRRAAGPAP